jgi:hypothetical protein
MPIKSAFSNYNKYTDFFYITILLTVASSIGIYLLANSAIIAKDGVTFIQYAENLQTQPAETMLHSDQHPGYPIMILAVHKIMRLIVANDTPASWIISAQIVVLFSRLLAVVALYYLGKILTDAKSAFQALLILILLPAPAEYGSDVLSDWPNMLFLTAGMLWLIYAVEQHKWCMFGLAGLSGGIGYLIRPEASQIIIFGLAWLVWQLFQKQRLFSRPKTIAAIVLLLTGFLVVAGPYMKFKGALFPKKGIGEFSLQVQGEGGKMTLNNIETQYNAGIFPIDVVKGTFKLIQNIAQTLMWFFLVPLLVGAYQDFRSLYVIKRGRFFIFALILFNIPIMLWLYSRYGYMSIRHSMTLVVFTVFYIPAGINTISLLLTPKTQPEKSISYGHPVVLTAIGITICVIHILRPVYNEKVIYRQAAQWLRENTGHNDVIAVSDLRISFYAERKGIKYNAENIPDEVDYITTDPAEVENTSQDNALIYFQDKKKHSTLGIYRHHPEHPPAG